MPPVKSYRRGFLLLFVFVVGVLGPAGFLGWKKLYLNLLERDPPTITVKEIPKGFGAVPTTLHIELHDASSGLDEVIVRRNQDGETKELFRKSYEKSRVLSDTISLTLSGKELKLHEGSVQLSVVVFDNAFWSNKETQSFDLKVDYRPPILEVISAQHNVVRGGCELAFYRVVDRDQTFAAVMVGSSLFPGFPAKTLDPEFARIPDLYFSFFALPLNFDESREQIKIFARDDVGNSATAPIYYTVGDFVRAKRERQLAPAFIENRVEPLFKRFDEIQAQASSRPPQYLGAAVTVAGQIERFRAVNENYRDFVNQALQSAFLSPKPQRYWSGRFQWFPGSLRSFFGEEQRYLIDGINAGSSISFGEARSGGRNEIVQAANRGVVVFADDFGPYGKTVIVDHGFGLTSLYGHLDSISCTEGDVVEKGREIGLTGDSGLSFADSAGSDYLHFEFRLFGRPVRPAEWWDARWIEDHIEAKIRTVKRAMGIVVTTPILER